MLGHPSLSTLKVLQGRPENVQGTSRINLPGTSLKHRIRTSPERHFRTSLGRQIGTSPGRSNRIFRGRWRGTSWGPIFAGWVNFDKTLPLTALTPMKPPFFVLLGFISSPNQFQRYLLQTFMWFCIVTPLTLVSFIETVPLNNTSKSGKSVCKCFKV